MERKIVRILVKIFVETKVCYKFARSKAESRFAFMVLAYGVIGNTTDFGSVILGSSPSRPTETPQDFVLRGFLFVSIPVN